MISTCYQSHWNRVLCALYNQCVIDLYVYVVPTLFHIRVFSLPLCPSLCIFFASFDVCGFLIWFRIDWKCSSTLIFFSKSFAHNDITLDLDNGMANRWRPFRNYIAPNAGFLSLLSLNKYANLLPSIMFAIYLSHIMLIRHKRTNTHIHMYLILKQFTFNFNLQLQFDSSVVFNILEFRNKQIAQFESHSKNKIEAKKVCHRFTRDLIDGRYDTPLVLCILAKNNWITFITLHIQ